MYVFYSINIAIYFTRVAALEWDLGGLVTTRSLTTIALLLKHLCSPDDEQTWACLDAKSAQLSVFQMYESVPQ